MNTLTIILLIYVVLDIVCDIIIVSILAKRGWYLRELASWFRNLMSKPQEDFVKDIIYYYGAEDEDY